MEDRDHPGDPEGQGWRDGAARGLGQERIPADPGICLLQLEQEIVLFDVMTILLHIYYINYLISYHHVS